MQEKVVVTGLGIISAIGLSTDETVKSLLSGTSGVGKITFLDTVHTAIPCAEVQMSDDELRKALSIAPEEIITRTSLLGIVAVREAIRYATIAPDTKLRIGFISGTTVGGMEKSEEYYTDFISNDNHREYIDAHDCGACTEKIADYFKCFGYVSTISTACSSAANAIILAAELIKNNILDVVVAGGTECLTKFHLNGFNTLMILDSRPCRPFDDTRAGLNLGEGAAYLVLESESVAKQRNAEVLCSISGYGNACDAYHQTASSPEGKGAVLSITKALKMAALKPDQIDYINAHGTGTGNNDISEAQAMLTVFGDSLPPFSSTKPFTGHTTSAAGGIEAVISILAMKYGFLPQNLNFATPMHDLPIVPLTRLKENEVLNHVLSNSFGFGGNNSTLIFSHK
jgi:3-oxoacyl-[acyl-carrier-protein] synthase II